MQRPIKTLRWRQKKLRKQASLYILLPTRQKLVDGAYVAAVASHADRFSSMQLQGSRKRRRSRIAASWSIKAGRKCPRSSALESTVTEKRFNGP
jgi:hypothetical protein